MPLNLDDVNMFSNMEIRKGDIVLYSADFNGKYSKADVEVEPLRHISDCGANVVILAHKGRLKEGNTEDLKGFANYLGGMLDRNVYYYSENATPKAIKRVGQLEDGDIIVMGNVRMNEGEEAGSVELAKQYANLALKNKKDGKKALFVAGGPGKVHRKESSNYWIMDYLPACASPSIVNEMQVLEPFVGKKKGVFSVAVIGGIKTKEKVNEGLANFAEIYDAVIPMGGVANTIYSAQGKSIGKSVIRDGGKSYEEDVLKVLNSSNTHKICLPEKVIIAKPVEGDFEDKGLTVIDAGVPDEYMIVDFELPVSALGALWKLEKDGGRMVVAGTPGIAKAGFTEATNAIAKYANNPNIETLVLGGDTGNDLQLKPHVKKLTGGGANLHILRYGTSHVWEKLKENKNKFAKLN